MAIIVILIILIEKLRHKKLIGLNEMWTFRLRDNTGEELFDFLRENEPIDQATFTRNEKLTSSARTRILIRFCFHLSFILFFFIHYKNQSVITTFTATESCDIRVTN